MTYILSLAVDQTVREATLQVHGSQEGSGRRLHIQHIRDLVPAVLVCQKLEWCVGVRFGAFGEGYLEETHFAVLTVYGTASGPSRVPGHDGVVLLVVSAGMKLVMNHHAVVIP